MQLTYYVVDAFSDEVFQGNQAGICLCSEELDPELMQAVAAENNLAETAFLVEREDGYGLRWFTPEVEIDLCGHATLGSAHILLHVIDPLGESVRFHTRSGILTVQKKGDLLEMDFPARPGRPVEVTPLMTEALGSRVLEAHLSRDLMLVLENEDAVRLLSPDMALLKTIPEALGVVVTAKGESCDFVSRFFAPGVDAGSPEDPVTGSTHCTLVPYWSARLDRKTLLARQLSRRGGTLYCEDRGDRVGIAGHAVCYLEGTIRVPG